MVRRVLPALVAASFASGCTDTSELASDGAVDIEVEIEGGLTCNEVKGALIAVGEEPMAVEQRAAKRLFSAESSSCDAASGRVLGASVQPEDPARIAIVALVGVTTAVHQCGPPEFQGCVVGRASVALRRGSRAPVRVKVNADCLNVACDAFSTCRAGACVSAESQQSE